MSDMSPDPLGGDGEELLPGAAPTSEEEGGDDEEARHRLAIPARGGRRLTGSASGSSAFANGVAERERLTKG